MTINITSNSHVSRIAAIRNLISEGYGLTIHADSLRDSRYYAAVSYPNQPDFIFAIEVKTRVSGNLLDVSSLLIEAEGDTGCPLKVLSALTPAFSKENRVWRQKSIRHQEAQNFLRRADLGTIISVSTIAIKEVENTMKVRSRTNPAHWYTTNGIIPQSQIPDNFRIMTQETNKAIA